MLFPTQFLVPLDSGVLGFIFFSKSDSAAAAKNALSKASLTGYLSHGG
jgi:hypothetical protein